MDVNIYWEGTEITNKVISYDREEDICESSSTIGIVLEGTDTNAYDMYDTIVLYEGGTKKATYRITSVDKRHPAANIELHASNSQKNLLDTYIDADYPVVDNPTELSRYWISLILDQSDVSYAYDTDDPGQVVPEDENFGHDLASNIILKLLQYSGWYLRYDADGVARIGKLDYDTDTYTTAIGDTQILSVKKTDDDRMLRNRAVVWGKGDPTTKSWIFADVSRNTPWNYDINDKRAVVIQNPYVANRRSAYYLANMALNEFARITEVKTIEVVGTLDVVLGNRIRVNSKDFHGVGLITGINVRMSSSGTVTELTLDKRCPRLVGVATFNGYVYVGTVGNGVWRKGLSTNHTWSDFSTGLANLTIRKLAIQNGIFACVDDVGDLYTRYVGDSAWVKHTPSAFYDSIRNVYFSGSFAKCTGCTIDKTTSDIYATYYCTYDDPDKPGETAHVSWVVKISYDSITHREVIYEGFDGDTNKVWVTDIDNNGKNNFLAAYFDSVVISGAMHQMVGNEVDHIGSNDYNPKGMFSDDINCAFPLRYKYDYETEWWDGTTNRNGAIAKTMFEYERNPDADKMYFVAQDYINGLFVDDNPPATAWGYYYYPLSQRTLSVDESTFCYGVQISEVGVGPYRYTVFKVEITAHDPDAYTVVEYAMPDANENIEFVCSFKYNGNFRMVFVDPVNLKMITFDPVTNTYSGWQDVFVNWYSGIGLTNSIQDWYYAGHGCIAYGLGTGVGGEKNMSVVVFDAINLTHMNTYISDYATAYIGYDGDVLPNFETGGAIIHALSKTVRGESHAFVLKVDPAGGYESFDVTEINGANWVHGLRYVYRNSTKCWYGAFDENYGDLYIFRAEDLTLHSKYIEDPNFVEWDEVNGHWDLRNFSSTVDDVYEAFYKTIEYDYLDKNNGLVIAAYVNGRQYFLLDNMTFGGYGPVALDSNIQLNGYSFACCSEFDSAIVVFYPILDDNPMYVTLSNLLRQDEEEFKGLGSLVASGMWVDCSKDLPIFVRGGDPDLNNGEFQISFDGNNLLYPNNLLYASDKYAQPITGGQYITDYRSSDFATDADGYERVGLLCQNNPTTGDKSYLRKVKYDFTNDGLDYYIGTIVFSGMDWNNEYAEFDNIVRKVETTNLDNYPFVFVTTAEADGTNTKFYQKDPFAITEEETTFVDRTNNLPVCDITIIKVDDAI